MPHEGLNGPGLAGSGAPRPSNGNMTSLGMSDGNTSSPGPSSRISGNQDPPDQSEQSQGHQPTVLGTCFQDSSGPPDALTLSGWSLQVPDLFFGVETQEEQIPPSEDSECGPDGNREDTGVITPPKERVSPSIQSLRTWRQQRRCVLPDDSEAEEEQKDLGKKEKDSPTPESQRERGQKVSQALVPASENQQGRTLSLRQSQHVSQSEESKDRPKSPKHQRKGNESREDQCPEEHCHHCQQQQLQGHNNGSEEEGHSPLDPDITTCQLPCCSGKRKSKGKCQICKDLPPPKPPMGERGIGSPSVVKNQSLSLMTPQSKGPSVVSPKRRTDATKVDSSAASTAAALATRQKKPEHSIRQRHPILSMPKYERKCLIKFVTGEGVRTGHEDRCPSVSAQVQDAAMSSPSVDNLNLTDTIQEPGQSMKEVTLSQAQENNKLVNERENNDREGDSSPGSAEECKQAEDRDGNSTELCLVSALQRSLSIGQEESASPRSEYTPSAEGQRSGSAKEQPEQLAMEIDEEIKESIIPVPLSDKNAGPESPQEPERPVPEVSASQPQQNDKVVKEQSDSDQDGASSAGSAGILEELAEDRDGNMQLPSEPPVSGGLLAIGQSADEEEKDASNKGPSSPEPANGERLEQQAMDTGGNMGQSMVPSLPETHPTIPKSKQETESSAPEVSASQLQLSSKLVKEQSDEEQDRVSSSCSAGTIAKPPEGRGETTQISPAASESSLATDQSVNEESGDISNGIPSSESADGSLEPEAMETDGNTKGCMVPSLPENCPKSKQEPESSAPEVSASQLQQNSKLVKEQSDEEQDRASSSCSAGKIAKAAEDRGETIQKPHAPAVPGSSLATDQSANEESGDISNGSPSSGSTDESLEPEAMETDRNTKEFMVPSLPENCSSVPSSMRETERSASEVAASQPQQKNKLVKGQSGGEQDTVSSSSLAGAIEQPSERYVTPQKHHAPAVSESSLAPDLTANEESGDVSNGSPSSRSADGSIDQQEAMDEDGSTKESIVSSSPESGSSAPDSLRGTGRTAPDVAAITQPQQNSNLVKEQRNDHQDRPFSFLAAGRSGYLEYQARDRDGNTPSCFMPYSRAAWAFGQYGSVIGGSTEISNADPSLGLPQGIPEQQAENREVNTSRLVVPLPLRASTFGPQIAAAFMQQLWIENSEPRDEGISTMQSGESGNQEGQQTDDQESLPQQNRPSPGQEANSDEGLVSQTNHGSRDSNPFAVYAPGLLGIRSPEMQDQVVRKSMNGQRMSHRRKYGDASVKRFREQCPEAFQECDRLFGKTLMQHFLSASITGTLGSREVEFLNMVRNFHRQEFPEEYSRTSPASTSTVQSQPGVVLNGPAGASPPAVPGGAVSSSVPTSEFSRGSDPVVNSPGTPNEVASAGDQSVPRRPSEVATEVSERIPSIPPSTLSNVPKQPTVTINGQSASGSSTSPHQTTSAGINSDESMKRNEGGSLKSPAAVSSDMHVKEPFPSDTEDSSSDGQVQKQRRIVQKVEDWRNKSSHLEAGQKCEEANTTADKATSDEAGLSKPSPPEVVINKSNNNVPKDGTPGSGQSPTAPTPASHKPHQHEAEGRPFQKPPVKETASQTCQTETLFTRKMQQVDVALQTDPVVEAAENDKAKENERKEEEGKARGCKRKAPQPAIPSGCQICQVANGIAPKPPSEHDSGHEDSDGPSSPKNKRVSGASANNQGLPAEQPTVVRISLDKGPVPSSSQPSSCQVPPMPCQFHAKYTCSSCHQPNEQPCVFDACASHAVLHGGPCRSAVKKSLPAEGTAAVRINCQGVGRANEGQCQHSNQPGPSTRPHVSCQCPQKVTKSKDNQPSTSANLGGLAISGMNTDDVFIWRRSDPLPRDVLGEAAIHFQTMLGATRMQSSDTFGYPLGAMFAGGQQLAGRLQMPGLLPISIRTTVAASAPGTSQMNPQAGVANQGRATANITRRRAVKRLMKYRESRVKSSIATQARLIEARKSSAPNPAGQKENPGPSGTKQQTGMKKNTNSGKSRSPARQAHSGPLTRQREEELYSRYPQRISLRISERQYKKWCVEQDFQQAMAAVEGDQEDQDRVQQSRSTSSAGPANAHHSMDAPGPSSTRPHQGKRGGGRTNGWANGAT